MPQKKTPKMTSTEVGALIASEGKTTDPEEANLMAEGKLLDPDMLVRAFYRREIGFDFTVLSDQKGYKWIVRDEELHTSVTAPMSEDPTPEVATARDAEMLARAVMKLKRLHDKTLREQADAAEPPVR